MREDNEITPYLFHEAGAPLDKIPHDAIVAIATVRDEAWRLPFWLAYHRWLGVDHFIVTDNRSKDRTREILADEQNLTLLRAPGSYDSPTGIDTWIEAILAASPQKRWNLLIDADELFASVPWQKGGLRIAVRALEDEDADVAYALMVDCYPDYLPLDGTIASAVPWQRAPWFDAGPYAKWNARKRRPKLVYNGVRERIFWPHWYWQRYLPKPIRKTFGIVAPPFIVKAPLFRNSALRGLSVHRASNPAARGARHIYFVLHYKLDIDLEQKADLVIKESMNHADEYRPFGRPTSGRGLHLKSDRSRQFTGYQSLVDARFCRVTNETGAGCGSLLDADVGIETAWHEIRESGGRHLVETVQVPVRAST